MLSVDKFGIILVIAITAVAVGFAATGGLNSTLVSPQTERASTALSELEKEALVVKKITEDIDELSQSAQQSTEKIKELTIDAVSSKLPAKFVSIPKGTSIPGCEVANLCYDPSHVTIFVGGEIIWRNDDVSAHTVTSGTTISGPDGNFDSGLMKSGQTFSTSFEKSGNFPYFCMIHPWATGLVTVS